MEELDPIIRELGTSALRPQELCSCTSQTHTHTLAYNRHIGLILVVILVLLLVTQQTFLWPTILIQSLAITVSAPVTFTRKRTK